MSFLSLVESLHAHSPLVHRRPPLFQTSSSLGPSLAPLASPLTADLLRRSALPSLISSSCATCRVRHCIVRPLAADHDPPQSSSSRSCDTLVRRPSPLPCPRSSPQHPHPLLSQLYLVFGLRSSTDQNYPCQRLRDKVVSCWRCIETVPTACIN